MGESYAAIGSTRTEVVEVSEDECIVEGDDVDALTFSKGEANSADTIHRQYLMFCLGGYMLFQCLF